MALSLQLLTIVVSLAAAIRVREVKRKRCIELAALTLLIVKTLVLLRIYMLNFLLNAGTRPYLPPLRPSQPHRQRFRPTRLLFPSALLHFPPRSRMAVRVRVARN